MSGLLRNINFSVGLFCLALFAFLAAVFMIGEAEGEEETLYTSAALKAETLYATIV